jgi:hypothetical protein
MWWYMPIISATREAEEGGSKSLTPGVCRKTLSKNKIMKQGSWGVAHGRALT